MEWIHNSLMSMVLSPRKERIFLNQNSKPEISGIKKITGFGYYSPNCYRMKTLEIYMS